MSERQFSDLPNENNAKPVVETIHVESLPPLEGTKKQSDIPSHLRPSGDTDAEEAIRISRTGVKETMAKKSASEMAFSPDPNYSDRVAEFLNNEDRAQNYDPDHVADYGVGGKYYKGP